VFFFFIAKDLHEAGKEENLQEKSRKADEVFKSST